MKPQDIKKEIEKELDEIDEEWEKHRTMNTCSICDSPKGHTSIKSFLSRAFSRYAKAVLEELEVEDMEVTITKGLIDGKKYPKRSAILFNKANEIWRTKKAELLKEME